MKIKVTCSFSALFTRLRDKLKTCTWPTLVAHFTWELNPSGNRKPQKGRTWGDRLGSCASLGHSAALIPLIPRIILEVRVVLFIFFIFFFNSWDK